MDGVVREIGLADMVGKTAREIPPMAMESPNTPWPLRMEIWQPDNFLGIVIPNRERQTPAGVIIPDTKECQWIPHACQIVRISRIVENSKFLKALQEHNDPDEEGKLFQGPFVLYRVNAGYTWNFGNMYYVICDARSILGTYIPYEITEEQRTKSGLILPPSKIEMIQTP